jgi:hypothetical protein
VSTREERTGTRFVTRITRQLPLGTAYPSGTPDYTWVFRGVHVAQDLVFYVVCRSLRWFFWGRDCEYERGTGGIVSTAEERLNCEYGRGTDRIVNTTEERTGL